MKRILTIVLWMSISWTAVYSQVSYLNRPDLLEQVESCLRYTYDFSFKEARRIQSELSAATPGHPVPVFLEALIVYWENFPLLPSDEASNQFIGLMDNTLDLAHEFLKSDETYIEGVFFDLFGRAFKAMFWADNGKSAKVIPDLGTMYRQTKEGFELKDQFVEFYFSTGLYNYYIEAYPEAHPAYKPLLSFMHKGDREMGLQQLSYAINHTVFLKVESIHFMSLIMLNYENDLKTAAIYAEKLVRDYPRNIYFRGHLINILLHQNRFNRVQELLDETRNQHDSYAEMIRTMSVAFMDENESGKEDKAVKGYLRTIEMAETFGTFADTYQAIGYMGLSRLYKRRGLQSQSNSYARKASRLTHYSYILDYHSSANR